MILPSKTHHFHPCSTPDPDFPSETAVSSPVGSEYSGAQCAPDRYEHARGSADQFRDGTRRRIRARAALDVAELAAYLGVPVSTVYDWRTRGKGPAAYRFGKHLKFGVSDVRVWVAEQRDRP